MKIAVFFALLLFGLNMRCYSQSNKQTSGKLDSIAIEQKLIQRDLSHVSTKVDQLNNKDRLNGEKKDSSKFNNSWIEKSLPSIVALLVVIISSLVSIRIAKIQIAKDLDVASEQLRTQESLGEEQLRLGREQLEQSLTSSMEQIKANNILKARISWIQDLRNAISEYLALVIPLAHKLIPISSLIEQNKPEAAKMAYNGLIDDIGEARKYSARVKLFLTSSNEEHAHLLEILNNLEEVVMKNIPTKEYNDSIDDLIGKLEIESRVILKDTWEQAKRDII